MVPLPLLATAAAAAGVQDLGGSWTLTGPRGLSLPARVPGSVHLDLISAGVLGDPYYRFNDVDYRWVALGNWTYTRTFAVDADVLAAAPPATLVAEGLDTAAEVAVNGVHVLSASNMFRTWVADVGHLLRRHNTIAVSFTSAVHYARQRFEDYSVPSPPDGIVPECRPEQWHGECHANFVRKEPCSFAWDWGPAFAPMGIYLPLRLVVGPEPRISAVLFDAEPVRGGSWRVTIRVAVAGGHGGVLAVSLSQGGHEYGRGATAARQGDYTVLRFVVHGVRRWWPRGWGGQPLYDLTASCGAARKTVRVGFRTVRWVQDPVPGQPGRTYYLEVNGVAVYMKGANWIPADAFQPRVTGPVLRRLLEAYTGANFNSLRIWGGGVYASEELLDLTDELGILVWEEFMFACSTYPVDGDYLRSVAAEVRDQAERMQSRASVVVWGGNNENEAMLVGNWYGRTNDFPQYREDYAVLYFDTVAGNLSVVDTSRPYLPSSPANGDETRDHPAHEGVWYNTTDGDVHHYDYESDCWDVGSYPSPRFSSEYGFQSYSSAVTLRRYTAAEDRRWHSRWMEHRQHLGGVGNAEGGGNNLTRLQTELHYRWPDEWAEQLWATQVMQGYCMKVQTEHYRAGRTPSEANTMGALYWQANDIWPTVSWSSLEYGGRWKVMHHLISGVFAPLLSVVELHGPRYRVYVVNDGAAAAELPLRFALWRWDHARPVAEWTVSALVPANSAARVAAAEGTVHELLARAAGRCDAAADCVLVHSVGAADNFLLLGSPKEAATLQDPAVEVLDVAAAPPPDDPLQRAVFPHALTVRLRSALPAALVWLETAHDGRFTDNAFFLPPQRTASVSFLSPSPLRPQQLRAGIRVRTLHHLR